MTNNGKRYILYTRYQIIPKGGGKIYIALYISVFLFSYCIVNNIKLNRIKKKYINNTSIQINYPKRKTKIKEFIYTVPLFEKIDVELENQGFKKENIVINATKDKKEYGESVHLIIEYRYNMNLPFFNENSLIINKQDKGLLMRVVKYGVCKV